MPTFTFQVDRRFTVVSPIQLSPTVELSGPIVTVPAGDSVIYRGLIELAGVPRYVFDQGERKLFTSDRAQLLPALAECYHDLVQI